MLLKYYFPCNAGHVYISIKKMISLRRISKFFVLSCVISNPPFRAHRRELKY